jgi:hypothetical protein
MKNPIKKSNLFHTPAAMQELEEAGKSYSGENQAAFFMGMAMAWNLASQLVEDEINAD